MGQKIYSIVIAPLAGFSAYKPTGVQVNVAFRSRYAAEQYLDDLYQMYHGVDSEDYKVIDLLEYGGGNERSYFGEFILREYLRDNLHKYIDYGVFIKETELL